MKKNIYAPTIARIERVQRLRFGEHCLVTKETHSRISVLLERLNLLESRRDNELWSFWIYASRGSIEVFGDYEELHEDGEYDTYEDFVQAWKDEYPKDTYWYEITVSRHNEYFALSVNNSLVISLAPERTNAWYEWDYVDFLDFLIEHLDKIISGVKDGTYNSWLATALPYRYRMGIISRKKLWGIDQSYKDWSLQGLTEQEIAEYSGYNNQDALQGDTKERCQTMTTQRYFDICAICYLAAKYEGTESMTSEQMYMRFADDRDGGLRTIDYNSPEEFERWYALSMEEKWKIENPSHLWELRAGSSYSRIHLYLLKDDGGFYVKLSGGEEPCTDDLVRMYSALKRNRVPVVFPAREVIAKKVLGEDFVGIVPCTDWGWTYSYSGFPRKGVISFLSFNSENIPHKNEQAVIEATEWIPLPTQRLKNL